MIHVANTQTRPIFAEGSFFGSCSQFLTDLVNKVKEVCMAVLRTILPCFFSAAPAIDPSRVSDASQTPPHVQVPVPGQVRAPEVPPIQRQAPPPAQQQQQQQEVELAPPPPPAQQQQVELPPAQQQQQQQEVELAPPPPPAQQQQVELPPAQQQQQQQVDGAEEDEPLDVGALLVDADQLDHPPVQEQQQVDLPPPPPAQQQQQVDLPPPPPAQQQQQQAPAPAPAHQEDDGGMPELEVVPVGDRVPPPAQQQQPGRVQLLLAQLDQIRQDRGAPAAEHKVPLGPIAPREVLPVSSTISTLTLSEEDVDGAASIVLQAFRCLPGSVKTEELDGMVRTGLQQHKRKEDASIQERLAENGLALGDFAMEQQKRYAQKRFPTISFGPRGHMESTYCKRISEAAMSLKLLSQATGRQEFGLIQVDDWVYGLMVTTKGMKGTFYFVNPYSDPIRMDKFSTSSEFAQFFTTTIRPELANHNFQYSLTPIKQAVNAGAAAAAVEEEDEEADVDLDDDDNKEAVADAPIVQLKANVATGGFYAACTAASSFQGEDFEAEQGLVSDLLKQGLSVLQDAEDAIPPQIMEFAGAKIAKLDGERNRAGWVQELAKTVKDKPIGVVLTNRQFTFSYALIIVPKGDETEFRLFSANAEPATFVTYPNMGALLKDLPRSQTQYSAYMIGAYERVADLD
ncbi:MAG: hypothetical protein K1X28_09265 [Parachlamydiales bacterium]|nr:hypothetical protein [Parachlamydiales bacterium]